MEHNKLYKVTRKILDELIKALESRTSDTMDYNLDKAIEKAKAQLEVLDEMADDSLSETERNRMICFGWNALSGNEVSAE